MKSRILVAVIGVPVLLYVVLAAPPIVMLFALCLLAGIGSIELQQCVSGGKWGPLMAVSACCGVFPVVWWYNLPAVLTAEIIIVLAYAIFQGGKVKFNQIMAALGGGAFLAYSFAAFLRLGTVHGRIVPRAYLLLPFILSFACDTFAFFAGKALGKHKLAPKVSPHKTVEGSVGGLAGNLVCGLLFVWVMDRFFGGCAIGYGPMALMALLCGVAAQIGDLSFSLIKREFGIKDYGHIFLAHGGVLDRFDSVLFVAPVVEMIFRFLA